MSSIKLKHSGGNGVSISAPDTNPTADRTVKLPSTDVDGVITTKDSNDSLQAVKGINGAQLSHRNLLINGGLELWQRGTSTTTDGVYQADRFWAAGSGLTYARSTDAPDGFLYSAKLTHGGSALSIGQPVELLGTGHEGAFQAGKKCTMSFYAKVDSGTEAATCVINFRDSKFSSTNSVAFTAVGGTSVTFTTSWQRFSKTFTIPTIGATNVMVAMEVANIGKTAYLTGFQLEIGDVATDFEYRLRTENLALCERYCSICGGNFYGVTEGNSAFRMQVAFRVIMRTAPSISVRSGGQVRLRYRGADVTVNSPTISNLTSKSKSIWFGVGTSGRVDGSPIYGRSQGGSNGEFILADAEM